MELALGLALGFIPASYFFGYMIAIGQMNKARAEMFNSLKESFEPILNRFSKKEKKTDGE